ncbi:MAG: stage V sporulation protein R [Parcubacteria group bacterium Greene0714_4]|nr:MAG: stage V sporulation protein R [Parcubacteria group bacterium Greene0714_4]
MFEDRVLELEALARAQGLDFFTTSFEVVPHDIMTEVAAYGLPTRARHWSYGKVYQSQHLYGTMGLSKIYEIVLNSDPCLAFLLDTNPEIANLLVAAHVFGHVDFFKNNVSFGNSNRQMVNDAVAHALRIDVYIERYGLETVEHLMDIGFALDRHVDFHKGLTRQPYPTRQVVEKERPTLPYADLLDKPERSITYEIEGERLPPHPERDLLWFLITYGKLENWQRDVLQIIREESYYFYPQFNTKILNEGWASYWHAELFNLYDNVTPDEMIEFARLHAGVVNPGGRFQINPYYLGYTILVDIEKRFDEMHKDGESSITGRQKLFEVRAQEDDISFLRNYLTVDLVKKLDLFAYGSDCKHPPGQKCPACENIVITDRERDAVVESLLTPRYNYGMPKIVVCDVANNILYLEHQDRTTTFLDRRFAHQTLAYIAEIWKHPVHILTSDEYRKDTNLTASY